MTFDLSLPAPITASLNHWHDMVLKQDLSDLMSILAVDAQFRSPAVFKPYQGAPVVNLILNTVLQVFEDFSYHRVFATPDGDSVVLEFKAMAAGKEIHGIDMIRFNSDGKITDFEVMIRPMSALQTLAAEMGARLAPFMPAK